MSSRVKNKVGLITGAAQGLGKEMARLLIDEGAQIVMTDTNYKDQILRYFQHNYKIYPTYKTEKNPDDNKYYCKLYKGDEYIECGIGISKKKSEQEASKNALMKFCVLSK